MTRRALLIGAETYGLRGVDADVALMEQVLADRGFDTITRCTDVSATYDGIRAALDGLVGATVPGDAVVLYYSGHGGRELRADAKARREAGLAMYVSFLVPVDIDRTTAVRFRGVLADEIGAVQRQLTDVTANVTTILDCCHSGTMARDAALRPRFVRRQLPLDDALDRADRLAVGPVGGLDSNASAVRVVASEPEQSAFEAPSTRPGGVHGVLTEALAAALDELGTRRVPWTVLAARIRAAVSARGIAQRPDVEGLSRRLPFSEELLPWRDVLPVTTRAGRRYVDGAPILGLRAGDRVRLVDGGRDVGEATVVALDGAQAELDVDIDVPLPDDLAAVPNRTRSLFPVTVDVPGALGAFIAERIARGPGLALVDQGGMAGILRAKDGLAVIDEAGGPVRTNTWPSDESGAASAVDLLAVLGAADRLRSLQPEEDTLAHGRRVDMVVELVDGQAGIELPSGSDIPAGTRITVALRNRGDQAVYIWLFDVGVSGRIVLITNDRPSGRRLEAARSIGDSYTVGAPGGLAVDWPTDVPREGARTETLVLIIAEGQMDLSVLVTGADARGGGLPDLVAEARNGDLPAGARTVAQVRFAVTRFDLSLVPTPR